MVQTILVGVGVFCVTGTSLALILCSAARGVKTPVPTRANVPAEDRAPAAPTG